MVGMYSRRDGSTFYFTLRVPCGWCGEPITVADQRSEREMRSRRQSPIRVFCNKECRVLALGPGR